MLGFGPISSYPISAPPLNYLPLPRQLTDVATLLVQTLVIPRHMTHEGHLVDSVAGAWKQLVALIEQDEAIMFQLDPRKFEELVAGWYTEAGFDEVILTPRSGDHGRDVIAVKHGVGCVRFIDSIKRYGPNHPVPADDVRALMGVFMTDPKATKGVVTTSSIFAPRILDDPGIASLVPYRLELVDGKEIARRLAAVNLKS